MAAAGRKARKATPLHLLAESLTKYLDANPFAGA
jgi:hypothetical protein